METKEDNFFLADNEANNFKTNHSNSYSENSRSTMEEDLKIEYESDIDMDYSDAKDGEKVEIYHNDNKCYRSVAGQYSCHLCSFVCESDLEFRQHLLTHYTYSCDKCDYASRTEGRLKRHIKDFHSTESPENFSGQKVPSNNPKSLKCKHCGLLSATKESHWHHQRTHLDLSKCLQCPQCPFITEYKHHLEYHTRNHEKVKPYKCGKCQYRCVNKSMLNSHKKSHSNVYQFRCADCSYASKYCHSLKQHLSRHDHQPAPVLNEDGSLPSYDNSSEILSMKRGPNNRTINANMTNSSQNITSNLLHSNPMNINKTVNPFTSDLSKTPFPNFPLPNFFKPPPHLLSELLLRKQFNPLDSFIQQTLKLYSNNLLQKSSQFSPNSVPHPPPPPSSHAQMFANFPPMPSQLIHNPTANLRGTSTDIRINHVSNSDALDLTMKQSKEVNNNKESVDNTNNNSTMKHGTTTSSYYCSKCDTTSHNTLEIIHHLKNCVSTIQ